jgi:hypothetical protein
MVTAAKWHLEAWFIADGESLCGYLGRRLGSVDHTRPDEIVNPKLHLQNLLEAMYTARIAEEIAEQLDPERIASRSPSFRDFDSALQNGHLATSTLLQG